MFVRFRKLPCGGFRPNAASSDAAYIACKDPWRGIPCRGHCHAKPRCRWQIGKDEKLAPYRLKVVLVENKRVNGKVKQETIAVLGSIDATWLPEFWKGMGVKNVEALKAEDWEHRSLHARIAFWKGANHRLKQLANRLGPDTKRIRMAAHARVPWPMESGLKRLEVLEAKEDLDFWQGHVEYLEKRITTHESIIDKAAQEIADDKAEVLKYRRSGAAAVDVLAKKLSAQRRP